MFDWASFTLLLYIIMRMSGFILANPVFGRSGIPSMVRTGFILVLSLLVHSVYGGTAAMPTTLIEFAVRLVLELSVGLVLGILMRFFLFIPEQGGEVIDTQMGMSMARTYDAGAQSSMTVSANILNILMVMLFLISNGHLTLLRIAMTSGEIIPFGTATLGPAIAERGVELFAECALLAVKLSLPILGAELLGQVGMGILMKAIPQINVFAINIELKVIIGLAMMMMLLAPMSNFLLEVETTMLAELRLALALMR